MGPTRLKVQLPVQAIRSPGFEIEEIERNVAVTKKRVSRMTPVCFCHSNCTLVAYIFLSVIVIGAIGILGLGLLASGKKDQQIAGAAIFGADAIVGLFLGIFMCKGISQTNVQPNETLTCAILTRRTKSIVAQV